jgi:ABC-2 type transport system permease protein
MILNGVDIKLSSLLFIPLLILELYIFSLGVSLYLAALFVKFRDISYIWEVIVQAGFYLTPIIYPLTKIPNETLRKLIFMNPIAQAIQDIRYTAVTDTTVTIWKTFEGGWYALIPFGIVVVVVISGVLFFRKESKYFAENI